MRDDAYKPLDNATVKLIVKVPDDDGKLKEIELRAEPSDEEAGTYEALVASRQAGNYQCEIVVEGPDGSPLGKRTTGWVSQSSKDEFRNLSPNVDLLKNIAAQTGGRIVGANELDAFSKSIPTSERMITETRVTPWWHHWSLLAIVIALFVGEWGIRRWKGMP